MKLIDMMAKACHYAQEHIDDPEAWDNSPVARTAHFGCVSYQIACFLAQNTHDGHFGVESDIILDQLVELPMKSEKQWKVILDTLAFRLGGWIKADPA